MVRSSGVVRSALLSTVAMFAMLATTAFAQSPALVPRDSRPFTPPDTQAPPPRPGMPAQQQPAAQASPAQAQTPVVQMQPPSQGIATSAPAPLLQKPAVPPTVTMQNGLLSIDASNSNLSDVLTAVKRATGATIEGAGSANERVVVHLGPGHPNEVISALLNGSRYDYVLLGSAQHPGAVTRIMLNVRQGGDQFPTPQSATNVPPPANASSPDEDGAQEDTPEQREQDVRQAEPPPVAPQGSPQPMQPGQAQNPQQPGAQNADQPKTPQQLFEEIQRMQQQRQQQNPQNQQQPTPPPPDE